VTNRLPNKEGNFGPWFKSLLRKMLWSWSCQYWTEMSSKFCWGFWTDRFRVQMLQMGQLM